MRVKTIVPLALFLLFVISGCAGYSCAPPKAYHDTWVANGESFPAVEACMTAIWGVGACAVETPAVAEVQIEWALECVDYCKKSSKKEKIKSCMGVSMNQDHGRPLCKRIPRSADMPEIENPWYIICSDISSTCQCEPRVEKKK